MAKRQSINTFFKGLNLDFDLLTIEKEMYILSENGRVIFSDQASTSWVNAKGNTAAITINSDVPGTYIPIGYAVINNLLILFSVGGGASEIGLITFDSDGIQNSYKTLMNDTGFTDKLNFSISNQIEAKGVYENEKCHRIYWVDGVENDSNPPRVFTFEFTGTDINLASDYSAVTTSPHSVDQQTEFLMGIIKFKETISGSITAGQYVYSYRLITEDGYATPWYPPTIPLFVTQDAINGSNWNEYEMEGTETFVDTGKGNRMTIKGIDTRYSEIEVAYTLYIANADPFESNIFIRTVITGDEMDFDHISNSGEPINALEIAAQTISFLGAKTLEIKDNVLYQGNIKERFFRLTEQEQEDLFANLEIEPNIRLMRSDEIELPDYTAPVPVDTFATFNEKPLTHQNPKTGLSTKRLNQSHTEDYTVNNDYVSYKGTQVSHQYTGFWRGEVYRLGVVFFDVVGNPSFVYHLADVTIGEQHEDLISWTRLKADGTTISDSFNYTETFRTTSNGTEGETPILNGEDGSDALSRLRIMGLKISGLDVTNIKDRISGFKIVRSKRDPQILGQGLIMPCVTEGAYTTPLPSPTQNWVSTSGTFPIPLPEAGGDIRLLYPPQSEDFYHLEKDTGAENTDSEFRLRPNTSCLYMPDGDFDAARIPTPQGIDRLKLVGVCSQKEFENDDDPRYRQWMHYNNYVVQKLDCTDSTYHETSNNPYPNFGDDASIVLMRILDYGGTPGGKIPDYVTGLDFYNSFGIKAGDGLASEPHAFFQNGGVLGKSDLFGHGKNRTLLFFHNNFGVAASPLCYEDRSTKGLASYFITNYKRPNAAPYGGINASSIEQSRFYSTGHFQPVNSSTIPCPDVVNDIEVFGGDCYLDYFGLLRIYGILLRKDYQDNDSFSDYGMGHLFPLESDIHHSLRQATNTSASPADNPMWPDVGGKPARVFYGDDTGSPQVDHGLFLEWEYEAKDYGVTNVSNSNVEEFNIAGVLFLEPILRIYFGLFSRFKDIDHYPVRWRYSDVKIYGEIIDAFRRFFVNDFNDLNGSYGQITSSSYVMNQIYSFQMKAFGRLRAFDRALIESQNLGTLTTGVGSKLDGIDYISTIYGNQHQWSLSNSGKALYWVDAFKREILRFAQDGVVSLSNLRNVNTYAHNNLPSFDLQDKPIDGKGVFSVYDSENEDVIYSLIDENSQELLNTKHIMYNETNNRFVDEPTFESRLSIPFKNYVYWFDPNYSNTLWLHDSGPRGSYMGNVYDSKITIVVNDIPYLAKAWDNIRMNINDAVVSTIKEIIMETQEQLVSIDMTTDTRWKYLEQILRAPLRGFDQSDRMRGKWIKITFVFDNNTDEKIIFTNLLTNYRPSKRH